MIWKFSLILVEYVLCYMCVGNSGWSVQNCLVSPCTMWSELSDTLKKRNAQSKVFILNNN
jgi:hypothetical protein